MQVGIPRETLPGETRVAATPETVKKLVQAGHQVRVERGAGTAARYPDADYEKAGAELADAGAALGSELVLKVRRPDAAELGRMKPGAVLLGMLDPFDQDGLRALAGAGLTAFALEAAPRTTRAQSLDVLSSQANLAGYKAVLLATQYYGRILPMMMTAAGTLKAARVVVLGAGVAGLQAIATARRLGAQVEGFDVRPETREQIESLGGRFLDLGVSAAGEGGYARQLTDEERALQQQRLSDHLRGIDVVVCTAAVPGRAAPKIVTRAMVEGMKPGSVIVDLAAETGGNCELTRPGETVEHGGVVVSGPLNLASMGAVHASEMYARNVFNFVALFLRDGAVAFDWNDELLARTAWPEAPVPAAAAG